MWFAIIYLAIGVGFELAMELEYMYETEGRCKFPLSKRIKFIVSWPMNVNRVICKIKKEFEK